MAYKITDDCISCGACEAECKNNAISEGETMLVTLDEVGFIVTDELMRTSAPGIFAAGDVRHNSFRQVITAAGDGAAAAMSAFKYVQEQGNGTRKASP